MCSCAGCQHQVRMGSFGILIYHSPIEPPDRKNTQTKDEICAPDEAK